MKRFIFVALIIASLSSCGRWSNERAAEEWGKMKRPAACVSGTVAPDSYCWWWFIDAAGALCVVEGYGLSFKPGEIYE